MVCKLNFLTNNDTVGKYDMLIYDKHENKYWGFLIKHTSNLFIEYDEHGKYIGQGKNLINAEIQEVVNEYYGNRESIGVLYNGKPTITTTGTEYYNISDFLVAVDKYRNMDRAMELLKNNSRTL